MLQRCDHFNLLNPVMNQQLKDYKSSKSLHDITIHTVFTPQMLNTSHLTGKKEINNCKKNLMFYFAITT